MMQAFYNAASGLRCQQRNLDVISNNIANINTVGFKKDRVNFKDALYVAMTNPEEPESEVNLMQGNGVVVGSLSKVFTEGNYIETGSVLDVAICSKVGFFAVMGENGEEYYTRDGNFKISIEDGNAYLVTSTGEYVLGRDNNRIQIEGDIDKLQIDEFGNLYNEYHELFATLRVVHFTNPEGLQPMGNNLYGMTEETGEPLEVENPNIRHKFLEQSNVDLTEEMTNMIKAQRAYQISSRALTTADEMERMANNLRQY